MAERITNTGSLSYRTKLMPRSKAESFAAALRANAHFTAVAVVQSERAKTPKFFVDFLPSNPARLEEMARRQQDARAERAVTQQFTFVRDPDHPFFHCFSHGSGETYEIDLYGTSCNCWDHVQRTAPNGMRCKHLLRFAVARRNGEIGEFVVIPAAPASHRLDQDRFDEIFADGIATW